MKNILEVQNLCKAYPESNFALKNISFAVPYGSIVGLVGENGAGKTSTINAILNTISKDGGSIKVFGEELTDEKTHLREDIGVVFDTINFSDNLTATTVAKVMAGIYKQWENPVFFDLITRLNLSADKKIKEFSRGMSMKLAIAVALSHQAKLLILDEPTSGLDPIAREEILDIFLDFIKDDQHAILLSSHITTDLEKIADYITFIHQGEITLSAQKDDLLYQYGLIRAKAEQFAQIDPADWIAYKKRDYQIDVLLADKKTAQRKYPQMLIDQATIEEIMILLVKGER